MTSNKDGRVAGLGRGSRGAMTRAQEGRYLVVRDRQAGMTDLEQ